MLFQMSIALWTDNTVKYKVLVTEWDFFCNHGSGHVYKCFITLNRLVGRVVLYWPTGSVFFKLKVTTHWWHIKSIWSVCAQHLFKWKRHDLGVLFFLILKSLTSSHSDNGQHDVVQRHQFLNFHQFQNSLRHL